jgi:uncharacterized protein YegL
MEEEAMEREDLLVAVILDRSGSMSGRTAAVIEHFNNYKEEVANLEQRAYMSIYQFDTEYDIIAENQLAVEIPDLTPNVYFARGGTALLDAIGRTIRSVDALENKPDKIVIVINTDGYENSSHEYNISQIKEMVTERQSNHDWQFVFVGAGIDAFGVGASYGINMGSTTRTTNDWTGYYSAYANLGSATQSFSSGASATMDMSIDITNITDIEEATDSIDTKINKRAKKKEASASS